ncbi:MAG: hypothetical protein Kow00121_01470 [Elainellaceae cyanobacterium]
MEGGVWVEMEDLLQVAFSFSIAHCTSCRTQNYIFFDINKAHSGDNISINLQHIAEPLNEQLRDV